MAKLPVMRFRREHEHPYILYPRWLAHFGRWPVQKDAEGRDIKVSTTDAAVLSSILSYTFGTQVANPGMARIAADIGVSTDTVNRSVRKWEQLELLEVERDPMKEGHERDSNVYTVKDVNPPAWLAAWIKEHEESAGRAAPTTATPESDENVAAPAQLPTRTDATTLAAPMQPPSRTHAGRVAAPMRPEEYELNNKNEQYTAGRQAGTAQPTIIASPPAGPPVGMEKLAEELCQFYGYQQLPHDWLNTLAGWQTEAHPPDHYERLIRWAKGYRDTHGGTPPTQQKMISSLATIAKGENGNGRLAEQSQGRGAGGDTRSTGSPPGQPYRSKYGGVTPILPRSQRIGGGEPAQGPASAGGRSPTE